MSLTIEEIPFADNVAKKTTPSPTRKRMIANHYSRRSMLKSVMIGVTALSVSGLDLVARSTRAYAATNWGDCPNWINRPDAAPDWTNCNPDGSAAGRINSSFCNDNNFHRTDSVHDIGGYYTDYRQRAESCSGKNAWGWYPNGVAPFPEPAAKRCSDGQVRYATPSSPGSWLNSTCKKLW